ncbi:endolytic transglycosylase MltG [Thalassotalea ponticola]|uniref:endolytic transglycosylase MltG n=1 Tax=Thalassotalea ponticola TaxID=1523392 RepID=UPI0025B55254|nr:endolytic transglycosylase MltG [Thalassotalea ponticola]MDN3652726.1 endolytic transglycosylase MltG [Thalassotalea ponticola]
MRLRLFFSALALLVVASGGVFHYVSSALQAPLQLTQSSLYTVDRGQTYHAVINDMQQRGWINSTLPFRIYAKVFADRTRIKSGTYQLSRNDNMVHLLAMMRDGREAQFKITFVEGSTFGQWLQQLQASEHITQSIGSMSHKQILQLLSSEFDHPEGLFFPDTYQYTAATKDIDILRQAHTRMLNVLNASWQQRVDGLPYKTAYEALIMASLIEKETAKVSEQPLIASVFVSRLKKGMRLQTDPTIIYGLGDRYTGDITYANLREKTAYNTYRIDGLPPTPIAMPGESAIQASVKPAQSDYLYFVSKGNGEHYFSKTLQEHNRAVDKYIRGKK